MADAENSRNFTARSGVLEKASRETYNSCYLGESRKCEKCRSDLKEEWKVLHKKESIGAGLAD